VQRAQLIAELRGLQVQPHFERAGDGQRHDPHDDDA